MNPEGLFDTHCHLFERGYHGRFGFLSRARGDELAAYERFREEFGITRTLVIGYEEPDRYVGNNEYIEGLAHDHDWIVPLRFVATGNAVGRGDFISLYATDMPAARDALAILEAAQVSGKPPAIVSLNAVPEALSLLAPAIRRLAETWILVSHLGLPGPVGSTAAAQARLEPLLGLADAEHVSVKISGQYAASAGGYPHDDAQLVVDVIADAFGIDRLVWGSDFSPCLEYISFEEAIQCLLPRGVTARERASILNDNATRLFDHYHGAAQ
ncbi:MAG: amidohydrolase family protein [Salinibacterium sp.]|nr:amidohydrolase family protein [Salinibacterium sp.]